MFVTHINIHNNFHCLHHHLHHLAAMALPTQPNDTLDATTDFEIQRLVHLSISVKHNGSLNPPLEDLYVFVTHINIHNNVYCFHHHHFTIRLAWYFLPTPMTHWML